MADENNNAEKMERQCKMYGIRSMYVRLLFYVYYAHTKKALSIYYVTMCTFESTLSDSFNLINLENIKIYTILYGMQQQQ